MKEFKKLSAFVAAVLIGAGTLAMPVAAAEIAPFAVYCNSAGENEVTVAFTGLNTSVKAFQISFELDGPVDPKEVEWGNKTREAGIKECDYDEATNTLNLYVVSDKNLVENHRLEIGTISFAVKSGANATGQYELRLKTPSIPNAKLGNIIFVDQNNEAAEAQEAPAWQGETTFTYRKKAPSGGGGSAGGGGGGHSGNTSSEYFFNDEDENASKPAPPVPTTPVVPPVITQVTTGGGSTEPIVPSSSSTAPEVSSSEPEGDAPPSEVPAFSQPESEPKEEAASFPTVPVVVGGVAVVAVVAVVVLKWKKVF